MNGRTHLVSGVAAGAWLAVNLEPGLLIGIAGVAVSALTVNAPDLDHLDGGPSRSMEWKRLRFAGVRLGPWELMRRRTVRLGLGPLVSRILRGVSKLATGVKHRGLTHGLAFALLIQCLTAGLTGRVLSASHAQYLGLAAGVGVCAALAGDLPTKAGLKHLLWPLSVQVSVPRCLRLTVGGKVERFLVFPLVVLAAVSGLAMQSRGVVAWLAS